MTWWDPWTSRALTAWDLGWTVLGIVLVAVLAYYALKARP